MSCQWVQWGIVLHRAWPLLLTSAGTLTLQTARDKQIQYSVVRGAPGITWKSLFVLRCDFGGIPTATSTADNKTKRDPANRCQFWTPILPVLRPTTSIRICLRSPLSLVPPAALPLDILGPVAAGFPVGGTVVPGLTAEVPGLTARSLGFSRLLKKICSTSCCVGLGALPR